MFAGVSLSAGTSAFAIFTFALILFLEHSPRFQSKSSMTEGNHRQSFAFLLSDEQGVNFFACRATVRVQTIVRVEGCLFCSDVQMCSHILPSPQTPQTSLATSPSLRQYRRRSGLPPASAASVSTTGSRGLALHTSNRRNRVNHKLKCQFSNVAAPLP